GRSSAAGSSFFSDSSPPKESRTAQIENPETQENRDAHPPFLQNRLLTQVKSPRRSVAFEFSHGRLRRMVEGCGEILPNQNGWGRLRGRGGQSCEVRLSASAIGSAVDGLEHIVALVGPSRIPKCPTRDRTKNIGRWRASSSARQRYSPNIPRIVNCRPLRIRTITMM